MDGFLEKRSTFLRARDELWGIPWLGTFRKAIYRISEKGPIPLLERMLKITFEYDDSLGTFVIKSGKPGAEFIYPCCLYTDCHSPTFSGKLCKHAEKEISLTLYLKAMPSSLPYTFGYKFGTCGIITSAEIRFFFDILSKEYGFNWKDEEERLELCYAIGQKPFVDKELGILITQPFTHSKTIELTPLSNEFHGSFFSCCRSSCVSPGVNRQFNNYYCSKDRNTIDPNPPKSHKVMGPIYQKLEEITKKILNKDIVTWREKLEILYTFGEDGIWIYQPTRSLQLCLDVNFQLKHIIWRNSCVRRKTRLNCLEEDCWKFVVLQYIPKQSISVNNKYYYCIDHAHANVTPWMEPNPEIYGIRSLRPHVLQNFGGVEHSACDD